MIGALISIVVYLLIAGLIYWAVTTIMAQVPLPEPIRTVINVVMMVILVLIVVFALLDLLGVAGAPGIHTRLWR